MATEYLAELAALIEPDVPKTEAVTDKLIQFADAVSESGPDERDRVLEVDAYFYVCKAWAMCCYAGTPSVITPGKAASQCRDAVLRALYTLTAGNPDIIDEIGWQIISQGLDKTGASDEAHILALRVIRNVSIKSEENREHFTWNLGLMDPVISIIIKNQPTSELVQEWCATMKALTLQDDPRVVYNRAPERKRVIYRSSVLPIVAGLTNLPAYERDPGALNAMVVFLATMAVNEEMCLEIESGNVLEGIHSIFKNHFQNKTLMRNTIALLRYLCVDQTVREKCSSFAFMKHIFDALAQYNRDVDVIDVIMSCCGMMTLRNACQIAQLMTRNGLSFLYQIAKDYRDDIPIMKGVCFTLRNICENGGHGAKHKIIDHGFTAYLNELLTSSPELKEYYITPVLKELGLADNSETDKVESGSGTATTTGAQEDTTLAMESEIVAHPDEEVNEGFGEAAEEHI